MLIGEKINVFLCILRRPSKRRHVRFESKHDVNGEKAPGCVASYVHQPLRSSGARARNGAGDDLKECLITIQDIITLLHKLKLGID